MEWLGYSPVAYRSSSKPISLTENATKTQTSFLSLCKSVTPPCILNPLLWNGHLQTIWASLGYKEPPDVFYRRKVFEAKEKEFAGSFAVDFVTRDGAQKESDASLPPRTTYFDDDDDAENMASTDDKPMLIVLHGITGGSHEIYVRDLLASLTRDGTWEACVVISRGCAMSKITSRLFYHGGATWDLRQTVGWLRERFPNRPLFAAGFSMGANILTNYLGEEGDRCVLKAAIVCSNPWNFELSALAMRRSWLGIYSKALATNLKEYAERHKEEIATHIPQINYERVQKTVYMHEFDNEATAPAGGYPSAASYYRDASCADALLAVRVPLLAINALDDPIAPVECIPFEAFELNPYCVLCTTTMGGHIGWFERSGARWCTRTMTNILTTLASTIDLTQSPKTSANKEAFDKAPGRLTYDPMRRKLHLRNGDSS